MARQTATNPDVAAVITAIGAYRGCIDARRSRAATSAVADDLGARAATEQRLFAALLDAAHLPMSSATGSRSIPGPGAVVSAISTGLLPTREALIADTAAARGIADRAVLAAAGSSERPELATALHDIADFYREWADWQLEVAKELTVGTVSRLRPSTLQRTVAALRSLAGLPIRAGREFGEKSSAEARDAALAARNQAVAAAAQITTLATDAANAAVESVEASRDAAVGQAVKVARIGDAAWSAGREAALRDGEREARRTGSTATAQAIHETRSALGVLDAHELPVKNFDSLSATEAAHKVGRLDSRDDLTTVEAYEREHKNRKTVLNALVARSAELTAEL